MYSTSRTIRALIIVGLICSLTVAVLSPSFMAAVEESAVAADKSAAKTCCCGTATGKCCGMSCCGVDAPKPQRAPVPIEDGRELAGSLVLAFCKTSPELVSVEVKDSLGWNEVSAVAGVRLNTLQARHVLMQT